jgi:hypothetical protein
MSLIFDEIEKIRIDLFKIEYLNELEDLEFDKTKNTDRIDLINKIINENYTDKVKKTNNSLNNMFDEIEHSMYNKPWIKLQNYHKIIKLKEYIDKTFDKSQKKNIEKICIDSVNLGNLNKNNKVDYNVNEQKIISITALKKNKNDEFVIV